MAAVIAAKLLVQQLAVVLLAGSGCEGHGRAPSQLIRVRVSWCAHACVTHDMQLFKATLELVSTIGCWRGCRYCLHPLFFCYRSVLLQCTCACLFFGQYVFPVCVRALVFMNLHLRMKCGIRLLS